MNSNLTKKVSLLLGANLCLLVTYAIAVVGIFGYWFFTLQVDNLTRFPQAASVYGHAYSFFAQFQTWVAGMGILMFLVANIGPKILKPGLIIVCIGFVSEYTGTRWGFPFGHYEYSDLLGWKILGKVPPIIPLSWFAMGAASYFIIAGLQRFTPLQRCVLAALVLMSWDLSLDPAMSYLTSYWEWEQKGSYFHSPFVNFVGWFAVALVISFVFEAGKFSGLASSLPRKWLYHFYLANLVLPIGMCLASGIWLAVVVSFLAYVCIFGLCRYWGKGPLDINSGVSSLSGILGRP